MHIFKTKKETSLKWRFEPGSTTVPCFLCQVLPCSRCPSTRSLCPRPQFMAMIINTLYFLLSRIILRSTFKKKSTGYFSLPGAGASGWFPACKKLRLHPGGSLEEEARDSRQPPQSEKRRFEERLWASPGHHLLH